MAVHGSQQELAKQGCCHGHQPHYRGAHAEAIAAARSLPLNNEQPSCPPPLHPPPPSLVRLLTPTEAGFSPSATPISCLHPSPPCSPSSSSPPPPPLLPPPSPSSPPPPLSLLPLYTPLLFPSFLPFPPSPPLPLLSFSPPPPPLSFSPLKNTNLPIHSPIQTVRLDGGLVANGPHWNGLDQVGFAWTGPVGKSTAGAEEWWKQDFCGPLGEGTTGSDWLGLTQTGLDQQLLL